MKFLKLLILVLFFSSCREAYFTLPQPIDSQSLTSFPVSHQGKWDIEGQTLTIHDKYFEIEKLNTQTIPGSAVHDSNLFKIKDDFIYEWNPDKKSLSLGYKYELRNDSITIQKSTVNKAYLGNEIELRKISEGHILSYKSDFDSKSNWYSLALIRKNENHLIVLSPRNSIFLEFLGEKLIYTHKYEVHKGDKPYDRTGNSYFNSKLNSERISTLIKNDCFLDTILYLDFDQQLTN